MTHTDDNDTARTEPPRPPPGIAERNEEGHSRRVADWRAAWEEARGGGCPDTGDMLEELSGAHPWDILDLWKELSSPPVPSVETHWYFSLLGEIAIGAWQYDLSLGSPWTSYVAERR